MNTAYKITVPLRKEPATITVIPSDNGENSYSTYFQLKINNEKLCDVFLNEENKWETCYGHPLDKDELDMITAKIEATSFKSCETITSEANRKHFSSTEIHLKSWFMKIKESLFRNKPAA